MTLKEKIMKLQTYKMFTGEDTVYVERDNVLKLLEQGSCEDCVDRAEVLKIYDEWFATCNISDKKESPKAKINALPPVSPIIRHKGHWILTDVEGNKVWHCHCSECGKDPQDYIGGSENWWLIKNNLPKFCPSCGADMREV